MPVKRFRSLDEMRRAQWLAPDDPRLFEVVRFVWELSWEGSGRYVPPRGVFKFRSIEEANAHRDAWEKDRIEKIKHQRKADSTVSVKTNQSERNEK
jgi:hypothetical protein